MRRITWALGAAIILSSFAPNLLAQQDDRIPGEIPFGAGRVSGRRFETNIRSRGGVDLRPRAGALGDQKIQGPVGGVQISGDADARTNPDLNPPPSVSRPAGDAEIRIRSGYRPGDVQLQAPLSGNLAPPSPPQDGDNYRYHNGTWWYWQPTTQQWVYWSNGQWSPYGASYRGDVEASPMPTDQDDRWRYRFHDNRWWYWQPNNTWSYYDDGRWVAFDPNSYVGNRVVRGYRYGLDADSWTDTYNDVYDVNQFDDGFGPRRYERRVNDRIQRRYPLGIDGPRIRMFD